jgi:hypothetical protein
MTKRVKSAAAASRQKAGLPSPSHVGGTPRGLRPSQNTTGVESHDEGLAARTTLRGCLTPILVLYYLHHSAIEASFRYPPGSIQKTFAG